MTSTLALFGRGSWLSSAGKYSSKASSNVTDDTEDYRDASWHLFCHGMPFLNLGLLFDKTNMSSLDKGLLRRELIHNDGFASACDLADLAIPSGKEVREEHVQLATHYLLAAFAPANVTGTYINPENLLMAAMFVANEAFLTLLLPEANKQDSIPGGRVIYNSPGAAVQKPVLSRMALLILSLLIGLQLLGLAYLAYYLQHVPTWSGQLDAMAMARIGASLHSRGVLPAIGPVSKKDIAGLKTVGGLIGITEKVPRRKSSIATFVLPELATTGGLEVESQWLNPDEHYHEFPITRSVSPELATTDGSDAELQRLYLADEGRGSFRDSQGRESSLNRSMEILRINSAGEGCESSEDRTNRDTAKSSDAELEQPTSTEEFRGSFEEPSTSVKLGIDAPRPILAADIPRRNPVVLGSKRAWRAMFKSAKPSSAGQK